MKKSEIVLGIAVLALASVTAFAAYDGSGTFNRTQDFTADRDAGPPNNVISADKFDDELDGMATGMGLAILKDGQQTTTAIIPFGSLGISTDLIAEDTSAAGVTIDGVLLKDSEVTTDTINEKTGAAGVTIDSVLLKDGGATMTALTTGTTLTMTGLATVGDITLSAANPEILGNDTNGILHISAGASPILGANVRFFGNTHATTPGDVFFRNDGTTTLRYIAASSLWDFKANDITTTGDVGGATAIFTGIATVGDIAMSAANPEILGADTNGILHISAGTANALGANLRLFGDTHATKAGEVIFRDDALATLAFDPSGTIWNFQANDITTTGTIEGAAVTVGGTAVLTTVDNGDWSGADLAVVNGGTGSSTAADARTALGVDAAGTDNSTDVTLAGTPDYITLSGQVITRGLIVLTTDVTGDLPVADGGTGSSTAAGARTNLGITAVVDDQNASTSGTTVDFTGIAAGVTRLKIIFDGVSVTSSDEILVQLGSGGGPTYKTTGYEGSAASSGASATATSSFNINVSSGATDTWSGIAVLEKMSDNVWVISGTIAEDTNTSGMAMFAGKLDLAATLTAIRVLNSGASTFDLGRISVRTME